MKLRISEVLLVSVVAFLSWFFMFCFDCYIGIGTEYAQDIRESKISPPFPDDRIQNLFWFLQITDVHFSFVDNFSISHSLESFCHNVITTVKPSLVIVSGDLTHAKFADGRRSRQFRSEWEAYRNVLQKCDLNGIPWLDIRGNHDGFGVPSFQDNSNYFLEFSQSWITHKSRSYCYSHHTSYGTYHFVALDACPDPGPHRPYNFFGVLHEQDLLNLENFSRKSGNHTLWFSHYPSAIISTDHRRLHQLMSPSIVHVCGHLHTLGGFVPRMYGRHTNGHLELELGDFKHSKRFRLMAFDHDLFSFVDTTMEKWPLILVTNPKNAQFLVPSREPVKRMANSTHIRILVFSISSIESVMLEIDDQTMPTPIPIDNGPLYVSPWQSSIYALGLHNMRITAKDTAGRVSVYTQQFSLDGTSSEMAKIPQMLLLTNFHSLLRLAFLFAWLSVLSVLLLSWINQSEKSFFYYFVRTKDVFYPYLLSFIYFGLGPWYLGELVTGVYGFVFVHGVYLMGHFIPGSMTYLHGTLQILLVHVPLLYYLNHTLARNSKTCHRWICTCIMIVCVMIQLLWILTAYPYGYWALIISPGATWPLVLTVWMIYKSLKRRI